MHVCIHVCNVVFLINIIKFACKLIKDILNVISF